MKILDRYIVRKFLSAFVLSIVLLLFIIIAFDISEKIDDFIDRKAPFSAILVQYYLNFIPYFINLFSPLFVFISVVFVSSRMAGNTEIVAILTGGVSFRRMLYPFILTAFFLGLVTFFLQNFLIPPANQKRLEFEALYVKKHIPVGTRNIHMQIAPGQYVFIESFNFQTRKGVHFTLESIDFEEGMSRKISADVASFDSISGMWMLTNVYDRRINDSIESMHYYARKDTILALHPDDFNKEAGNVEVMNIFELNDYIAQQKMRGADNVSFLLVERHRRIAFPFATVILTLIGVSLSSRKTRGGTGIHLFFGLSLSFAYILLMQFSATFATNGNMPAIIAVWIPNIVFGVTAYMLFRIAPK
ncbi:MAG: hypothetical protein C0592_10400 [Marinilabiliales bacterium]|nr:MAG: hypothetical protein C0592_10400 [Marinilabiliales bacterium]